MAYITDKDKIARILKEAHICRIGMSDGNRPYVVPVCFGYADNALYFHSRPTGKKMEILRANPGICFETEIQAELIGDAPGNGMDLYSVIGNGTAAIVEDTAEKHRGLQCITSHYVESDQTYTDQAEENVVVVRVDIDQVMGKVSGFSEETAVA